MDLSDLGTKLHAVYPLPLSAPRSSQGFVIHTCTVAYSKLLLSHYSTKQQLYANMRFPQRFPYECVKLEVVASPRNWADGLNWLQLKPIDRYVLNSLRNKFNAWGWAQGREGEMCPDKNAVKAGLHSRDLGVRQWDECGTCRHTRLHYPACSAFSSVAGSYFDVFECFLLVVAVQHLYR